MISKFIELEKLDTSRPKPLELISRVWCKDGFNISIQGHRGAYSEPREKLFDIYKYTKLEIHTSELVSELDKYYDCGFIYGYVPIELIEALLVKHGGIVKR